MKVVNNGDGVVVVGEHILKPGVNEVSDSFKEHLDNAAIKQKMEQRNHVTGKPLLELDAKDIEEMVQKNPAAGSGTLPPPGGGEDGSPEGKAKLAKEAAELEAKQAADAKAKAEADKKKK